MATRPASRPSLRSRTGTPSAGSRRGDTDSGTPAGTYFLGRYRVVDEIGVGGMASVHLARADGPGGFQKWVAIKRIHTHLAEDQTFIRMFLDEARIAARINHPNVAQVFDLGQHRDTYWIAMEYLHGEPVREVMRLVEEEGAQKMGFELVSKVIAEAAEGLHAAHELRDKNGKLLNLVHRDVSPHNLFLTYDGSVKVVDFGIAKVADQVANTRAGMLKGKLAYMSPEQVRGKKIDRRTDVFALGVCLWELTVGRRLFRVDSDLETLERVQACVVPSPSSIDPRYPAPLESVVMKALAKDPEKRYQTARELSRALQQFVMTTGQFVGSEEIGAYVRRVFADRFQKREEHLQWAAEVTQTIAVDDIVREPTEEVSILTYASDVQERDRPSVTRGAPPRPKSTTPPPAHTRASAARGTQAMPRAPAPPSSGTPPPASTVRKQPPPPPRPNAPADDPLPSYDLNTESVPTAPRRPGAKKTMLGLGMPKPPPPAAGRPPAPAPPAPTPSPARLPPPAPTPHPASVTPSASRELHDYGEDDDAVTRVAQGYDEFEELEEDEKTTVRGSPIEDVEPEAIEMQTSSISTVHSPPKSQQPAPEPVAPIVLSPEASQPPPPPLIQPAPPPAPQIQAAPLPEQPRDSKSLLIAVIAATTTLIALSLAALVVLKLTESPPQQQQPAAAQQPAAEPPAPAPAPRTKELEKAEEPEAAATNESEKKAGAVDPDSLPAEKEEEKKPVAKAPPGGPAPVAKPAAPAGPPGFLTVVCDPACDAVIAGGRNLGPSPVIRASLPPGSHGVTLRKSGSGTKSIGVTIKSGQTTARRVKM